MRRAVIQWAGRVTFLHISKGKVAVTKEFINRSEKGIECTSRQLYNINWDMPSGELVYLRFILHNASCTSLGVNITQSNF